MSLIKLEKCDLDAIGCVRMRRLQCLDDWLKHAVFFRRDQDHLRHIVSRKELQRVEEEWDVREWEQALGSVAGHRLEPIVK